MTLPRFLFWNVIGCVSWAFLIPKLGQFGGDILGWLWSLFRLTRRWAILPILPALIPRLTRRPAWLT